MSDQSIPKMCPFCKAKPIKCDITVEKTGYYFDHHEICFFRFCQEREEGEQEA